MSNIDEDGGILTFTISIQGDLCGQETLTLNSEYQTMTDSIEIQIENYSTNSIETVGNGNSSNLRFSIEGDLLVVSRGGAGAKTYSIPSLNEIDSFDNGGFYRGLDGDTNNTFIAAGGKGIYAYNNQDYTSFSVYNTPGNSYDVSVVNDYLYLADRNGGLKIFDISDYDYTINLESRLENTIDQSIKPENLVTHNSKLAYIKNLGNAIYVYDISINEDPNLIGTITENVDAIELSDNKLFALVNGALNIYDTSQNLELISTVENDSNGNTMVSPSTLQKKSDKLFIGGNGKVYTFDISGESAIALNTHNVSANVKDIEVHQGNIYVLGSNSIEILSLSYSPPVFSAISIENNSVITLDFSENVYSSADGNGDLDADDFTVSLTDPDDSLTLTSYLVSKISDSQYAFTVEFNGALSGNESITINPQNDGEGNYSIYSGLGVPMSTNQMNNTVDLVGPATITSTTISDNNDEITVIFSSDVYTILSDGTNSDLTTTDFNLTLSNSTLATVSQNPSSLQKVSQSEWYLQLILQE